MARGPAFRPLRGPRFRRSRNPHSVEALVVRIGELVAERQELRAGGAPQAAIERNRRQIARAQWELAHALIDRYLPAEPAVSAA
jgi:ribosomal protein L29